MNLTGKILIVANIVLAIAFLFLGAADWGVRQGWEYAEFRQRLLLDGLPVEEPAEPVDIDSSTVDFSFRVNETQEIDEVKVDTLKAVFQGASGGGRLGGEWVRSQEAEVKRVQQKVDAEVATGGREASTGFLLNLARSGEERDAVQALNRLAALLAVESPDPERVAATVKDLPYLASDVHQVVALKVLANVRALRSLAADKERNELLTTQLAAFLQTLAKDDAERGAMQQLTEVVRGSLDQNADNVASLRGRMLEVAQARTRPDAAAERKGLEDLADVLTATEAPGAIQKIDAVAISFLTRYFEDALAKSSDKPSGEQSRPLSEKRRQIAHLLFHLDNNPDSRIEWRKRVMVVVGKTGYVAAQGGQVRQYEDMAQRLRNALAIDQAEFEPTYQALVQRAVFLARQEMQLRQKLDDKTNEANGHEELRKAEEVEKTAALKRLDDVRKEAKDVLAQLAQIEVEQYDLLRRLREAQDRNFQLEGQLNDVELRNKGR